MSEQVANRPLAAGLGLESVGAALLGAAFTGGVAAADGGFFPESWAWVSVTTLFVATLLLIVRPAVALRLLDLVFLGGLLAFGSWVAVSIAWSTTTTGAVEDAWRMLAYVGAVALCLLAVERRTVPALLGGALVGIVAIGGYALLTRLLPDRLGDFESLSTLRLADPIGYWNGLGIYCAMGALLALGFAARSPHLVVRMIAAVAPVVLVTALYLTFSRGAWLALGAGLAAGVALDPRRLQLLLTGLVLAPWVALAVYVASRADALSIEGSTLADAVEDGHRLLVYVAVLSAAAACAIALLALSERAFSIGHRGRAVFAGALVGVALAGVAWIWVEHSSPWSLAERGWSQFRAGPRSTEKLSDRLFDLSSNGRIELWGIAWDDFRDAPVVGRGAGSYEQSFYERRETTQTARDAHSLYAETLGELGAVGLALLVIALAAPLVAAAKARRRPLAAGALAAYAAFLVHAGADWDWELAGVTLAALLAAGGLVIMARDGSSRSLPLPARAGAVALAGVLAGLALWSLLAAVPLGRAREAVLRGDWESAIEESRRAAGRAPWASDPWRYRGEAEIAQGQVAAARRSFTQAVAKEPGEWLPWLQLALATGGPTQQAALARAQALNPNEDQIRIVEDAVRNPAPSR